MNDVIYEAVITTVDRQERPHVAPFGVRYRGREVVLMPFKPSATLDNIRARSLAPRTFAMQLLVGFAAVASVLTLAGVYSVLALSVTTRRREIAIRSALGAARGTVMSMIVGDGLRLIAGGVVLGLGISFVLSRALRTLLFGVGPTDPTTLAAAALTFVVVALLACCIPAARAARVQPAEALKSE